MSYPAQKFENNAILKQNCNLKLFIAFKRPNIVVSVVFKKVLSLSLITLTVAFYSWHPNCSFTHRDEGVKVFVQNVVRLVQLGRRPEFLPQDRLGRVLRHLDADANERPVESQLLFARPPLLLLGDQQYITFLAITYSITTLSMARFLCGMERP